MISVLFKCASLHVNSSSLVSIVFLAHVLSKMDVVRIKHELAMLGLYN